MSFRSFLRNLGPGWLVRDRFNALGEAQETDNRVLYSIAAVLDASRERLVRGIKASFPGGGATEDALGYIGRDLMTVRGPAEPRSTYELRLQQAIDRWRYAGTAWSVLDEIIAYCTPHAVRVRVVNNHGNYYQIDRDGTRSRSKGLAWNWDDEPTKWSRFWVLIYVDGTVPWDDTPLWGDGGNWGEGTDLTESWGSTASTDDVAAIRKIVHTRKPLMARCVNVIVIFDDTAAAFELAAVAPPAPDGTWGHWSVNESDVQVPARSDDAIYWDG